MAEPPSSIDMRPVLKKSHEKLKNTKELLKKVNQDLSISEKDNLRNKLIDQSDGMEMEEENGNNVLVDAETINDIILKTCISHVSETTKDIDQLLENYTSNETAIKKQCVYNLLKAESTTENYKKHNELLRAYIDQMKDGGLIPTIVKDAVLLQNNPKFREFASYGLRTFNDQLQDISTETPENTVTTVYEPFAASDAGFNEKSDNFGVIGILLHSTVSLNNEDIFQYRVIKVVDEDKKFDSKKYEYLGVILGLIYGNSIYGSIRYKLVHDQTGLKNKNMQTVPEDQSFAGIIKELLKDHATLHYVHHGGKKQVWTTYIKDLQDVADCLGRIGRKQEYIRLSYDVHTDPHKEIADILNNGQSKNFYKKRNRKQCPKRSGIPLKWDLTDPQHCRVTRAVEVSQHGLFESIATQTANNIASSWVLPEPPHFISADAVLLSTHKRKADQAAIDKRETDNEERPSTSKHTHSGSGNSTSVSAPVSTNYYYQLISETLTKPL